MRFYMLTKTSVFLLFLSIFAILYGCDARRIVSQRVENPDIEGDLICAFYNGVPYLCSVDEEDVEVPVETVVTEIVETIVAEEAVEEVPIKDIVDEVANQHKDTPSEVKEIVEDVITEIEESVDDSDLIEVPTEEIVEVVEDIFEDESSESTETQSTEAPTETQSTEAPTETQSTEAPTETQSTEAPDETASVPEVVGEVPTEDEPESGQLQSTFVDEPTYETAPQKVEEPTVPIPDPEPEPDPNKESTIYRLTDFAGGSVRGRWGWEFSFTHMDGGVTPGDIGLSAKPTGTDWHIEDWSSEDTDEGQKVSFFIATRAEYAFLSIPGHPRSLSLRHNQGDK